jgi:hypothetical protein
MNDTIDNRLEPELKAAEVDVVSVDGMPISTADFVNDVEQIASIIEESSNESLNKLRDIEKAILDIQPLLNSNSNSELRVIQSVTENISTTVEQSEALIRQANVIESTSFELHNTQSRESYNEVELNSNENIAPASTENISSNSTENIAPASTENI